MFTAALPDNRLSIAQLLSLGDTAEINTVSLLLFPLFVFTKLLPVNALLKSVAIFLIYQSSSGSR
jgi:hypothetical protein